MKSLKKIIFIGFGCILPWVLCFFYYHLISATDLSMKPVSFKGEKAPIVCFVTYADGLDVYHQNRNILAYSALDRGMDFSFHYHRPHLDEDFVKNNPILNEKVGVGYWLWKPYIILKALERLQEGEYLLYADSGFVLRDGIRDFMLKSLADTTKHVSLFAYDPKDYGKAARCASGDVFAEVDCQTQACADAPHVMGGLLFIRKTPESVSFIQEWLRLCSNADLLTGRNQKKSPLPGFSNHQHDEGILSVLAAKQEAIISYVPVDQTFFSVIRMHRRKTDRESLLPYATDLLYRQEKKIIEILLPKPVTDFFQSISFKKDK